MAHGPGPAPAQLCGSRAGELRAPPQATGSDILPDAVAKEVRCWPLRVNICMYIYVYNCIYIYIYIFILVIMIYMI